MTFTTQFKVDLVDMKNAKFPEEVLDSIKDRRAEDLGVAIVKQFPFLKDEERSWNGELPESVLNREHQYVDVYEQRLVILTEAEATEIKQWIKRSNLSHLKIQELINLLS